MKCVVDANIIISALLGSKKTIEVITSERYKLYAPLRITEEVRKYKDYICEKSSISNQEFEDVWQSLSIFIKTVNVQEYKLELKKAEEIINERDINDIDYVACALVIGADFIWTNDKDFLTQKKIPIKTTNGL